jgi:hypothetical protein
MFSKTNLVSTLVTTVWGFLGGYLLWGIIGDPMLADHLGSATGVMREEPDFVHLILGCLVVGFAFSTTYSKWARGHHSLSEGAQFGLWIGLILGLGSGLIDYSTGNILDIVGTLMNSVIYIVHFVIMGILASLVYSKMSST